MLPASTTKKEDTALKIKDGSRKIAPHVAHLIISNLKDISDQWWSEVRGMLNSKSAVDRKFAITEINKIQLKSMPNQIAAEEGTSINVNIVNYGNNNPPQLHPKVIPGTVVESDG